MPNRKNMPHPPSPLPLLPLLCLSLALLCPIEAQAKGEAEIQPTRISASSTLYEEGYDYSPYQVTDWNWDTCWAEGAYGSGAWECLTFTFPSQYELTSFSILPGFWKRDDLFYKNAAPKKIQISSGSYCETFDLSSCLSSYGKASSEGFRFSFSSPLSCLSSIQVSIQSVREGNTYADCCITELHFYGRTVGSGNNTGSPTQGQGSEITPTNAKASSVLMEEGYNHGIWQLFDYDWQTAWVEGALGLGIGESLSFTFPAGTTLTSMAILPGYWKSEDLFCKNAAPTRIRVTSGKDSRDIDLSAYADTFSPWSTPAEGQRISFGSPLSCNGTVTVTLLSAREGYLYDDCCITEMHFFGSVSGGAANKPQNTEGDSSQKKKIKVTKEDLRNLAGFAYRLYEKHLDYPKEAMDVSLSADDLTAEDKAFAFYWYLYFTMDERCWHSPSYEVVFSTQDGMTCMEELYGSLWDEDWETFQDEYILRQERGLSYVNGTGDFGSAGMVIFMNDSYSASASGARLRIEGDVGSYKTDGSYGYAPVKRFQAYFTPTGSKALGGWQFSELVVSDG